MHSLLLTPLALTGALCLAGCGGAVSDVAEEAQPRAPEPVPVFAVAETSAESAHTAPLNVVLIVIDTLRADAVLDPAGRYDTPCIDRFAAEGIVFPRAFSAAPMTLPSHMSLFSSRPPLETGIYNNGASVREDLPLVAEWLAGHGYDTRAVLSIATLYPTHPTRTPGRGFATYDCTFRDIEQAVQTKERLFATLSQRAAEKPLFLFAHFSDPHEPYDAHGTEHREVEVLMDGEPLVSLVASDTNPWSQTLQLSGGRTVFEFRNLPGQGGRFRVRRFQASELQGDGGEATLPVTWEEGKLMDRVKTARAVIDRGEKPEAACKLELWINDVPVDHESIRRRYALDVAYVDRYVGELLAELERLGLYQDSLIVFTSDHGEALGEHKFFGHVEGLTDDQIHVPLIVKLPRGDGRRAELERAAGKMVTHLDVVPTLLQIAGLPPLPGQRGLSLLEPHDSVHLAQTSRPEAKKNQLALRDERYKLIYFPDEPRFVMYDLVEDPGELTDVFATRKSERPSWPERLHVLYQQSTQREDVTEEGDQEERDRMLKALGYGGGEE